MKLVVYNLEMTAANKFCTKRNMVILDILLQNTTYVVLFMRSTYIISEFMHHRLVVAMGGGKEV